MTFLSLFAGIGGLDLGLERAGMRCIGQVEIDPFCRRVLAKHWPGVPRFEDVRTFNAGMLNGSAELICGGFPCQDISVAGKGRQLEGERSGLWWEFHRIIGELRPAWVLAENVPALRSRGADDVLSSLEALGYAAWPLVVGAWAVGLPHKRDRVWIVAYCAGERRERRQGDEAGGDGDGAIAGREQGDDFAAGPDSSRRLANALCGHGGGGLSLAQREAQGRAAAGGPGPGELADGDSIRREGERSGGLLNRERTTFGHDVDGCDRWPSRPGEPQHEWEAPRLVEFPVGGAVDGVPVRLVRAANRDALKAYGNSVVPANAEIIGRLILQAHTGGDLNSGSRPR